MNGDLIDLENALDDLEGDIASIEEQISRAKDDARLGIPWQPGWLGRAQRALKHKRMDSQKLRMKIAEINRVVRQEKQKDLEWAFMKYAREYLDLDMFQTILDEARREVGQ